AVPSLRRFGHASAGARELGDRSRSPGGLSRAGPHQFENRLPRLLGAAGMRRRVPPRSLRTLRRHRSPQSSLLRMDSRLDRYLPADLWRHRRTKPGFPGTLFGKESCMKHLRAINQKARRIEDYLALLDEDVVG